MKFCDRVVHPLLICEAALPFSVAEPLRRMNRFVPFSVAVVAAEDGSTGTAWAISAEQALQA